MEYNKFKEMMDGVRKRIDFDMFIGLTVPTIIGDVAAYLYLNWADADNCNIPALYKLTENTIRHLLHVE